MKLRQSLQITRRWLSSRLKKRSGILLYHRINPLKDDPFDLAVAPENFEAQLAHLCNHYRPVPLLEIVKDLHCGIIDSGKVAITFDDGYADVLHNGLPLLEKYQVPATIYMIPGLLGQTPWWEEFIALILKSERLPQELSFTLASKTIKYQVDRLKRRDILKQIYPLFQAASAEQLPDLMQQLAKQAKREAGCATDRLMTVQEMRELAKHPLITLGAHTVNHVQLAALSRPEQEREIGASIDLIREQVGYPLETFSYPFGLWGRDFNQYSVEEVRRKGLTHAVAAETDVVTSKSDPFKCPRLWVSNLDQKQFAQFIERWL